MNVGNLKIHQWVITTEPKIVYPYIQYEYENPFEPIQLSFVVEDHEKSKYTYRKLTALVLYNTNYFHILIRYTQLDQISKFWTNVQNRYLSTR